MEKKMSSLLVTRNAEGTRYFVCDPTSAKETMAVCATAFKDGAEPDSLLGSIIALCGAAGEDPLEAAVRLAEYLIDDEELTKRIKDFVVSTFEEAVGDDFFEDEEEKEEDSIFTDNDTRGVEDFITYLKGMFE